MGASEGSGPRLFSPEPGSAIARGMPLFRWAARLDERAWLEVCSDRECTQVLSRDDVTGRRSARILVEGVGVRFWRVRAGGVASDVWSFRLSPGPGQVGPYTFSD